MKNSVKLLFTGLALATNVTLAFAQGTTAFTYQGQLSNTNVPVAGSYDFNFALFDASTNGNQISTNVWLSDQAVTNGLFTVTLDFGPVFDGNNRWLEIATRKHITGMGLPPKILSPRQLLTPTPYAVTAAGLNALRIGANTNGAPNLVGGASVNWVAAGVNGATIAGGGATAYYGVYAYSNRVTGDFGTVGGGQDNQSSGSAATVSGGAGNFANGSGAAVGGGGGNSSANTYATVAGGLNNWNSGNAATIGGGRVNTNSASYAFIGGGFQNQISSGASAASIAGGEQNAVSTGNDHAAVGGGFQNTVASPAAAVGGGWQNTVRADANNSFIGGGNVNQVQGGGWNATIGGGKGNSASGYAATVPGGELNVASGDHSFAGGYSAWAVHPGSFVWADATGMSFSSTTPNQFLIRAQGGVGINTNSPKAALHVVPVGGLAGQFDGEVAVKVLSITGGSDVAEPFAMASVDVPCGAVVVIDAEQPGRLKLSDRAYDTRVAGVVSGANGIRPGLSLKQVGALEGGQNVALTGRVYVQADASHVSIKPGDLLTTSDTPGYAMKVADSARAQGAILGKAMSSLASGRGLVLVLVTLQ